VPLAACPSVDPALAISELQAEQFLRSRRSIRKFRSQAVEREKIQRLIDMARYAPTAGNSQRVKWRVVTDRDIIARAADLTAKYLKQVVDTRPKGSYPLYYPAMVAGHRAGRDPIMRQAPVLLVASNPPMASNGMVDISVALAYLELMAPVLGLGTCWAGLVGTALMHDVRVKQVLGLPEDHANFYSMLLGYPRYRYHRLPERRPPVIDWE
jgi:nitroreductase